MAWGLSTKALSSRKRVWEKLKMCKFANFCCFLPKKGKNLQRTGLATFCSVFFIVAYPVSRFAYKKTTSLNLLLFSASLLFQKSPQLNISNSIQINKSQSKTIQNSKTCTIYEENTKKKVHIHLCLSSCSHRTCRMQYPTAKKFLHGDPYFL